MKGTRQRVPFARTTLYCCLAALLAGVPATVLAAPQGGEVVGGTGTISNSGATTLIQQQTSSLAIDWQSFNVAAGETVQFVQPTSTSVVLNRILDQNASQIFGAIDANGRVFLSNPNGLVFGETAVINAGSFVASGLDISADDFMQGNYTFGTLGVDGGAVINRGLIVAATGGSVTLVGSSVSNEGVILANYGTVNLGAGQTAVIDFDGDGLLRFVVDGAVLSNALGATAAVDNQGQISALGGEILLTAAAAQDIFSRVINNDGLIEAGRIDNTGGVVRLVGIGQGEVISRGTIDVSGQDGTSTGGTVQLLGEKVGLFGAATVDASGQAGGGTVLIGGDREGSNPAIRNASAVYLSQESQVNADATLNGDGGKVVVYADDTAHVYGAISAQGGAEGGNGGFVETSGKHYLDVTNAPDVSAPQGAAGEWLIDPYDLRITSGSDANVSEDSIVDAFTYTPTGTASSLSVDTIYNALYNGTTVTITTGAAGSAGSGDILWESTADLDYDGTGSGTLNLTAYRNIDINGDIYDNDTTTLGDSLNLNLTAGGTITGTASLIASSIDLHATYDITLTNKFAPGGKVSLSSTSGDITYHQENGVVSFGTVTASSGNVLLTNDGNDLTVVGSVTASGSGKGGITLQTLEPINSDIILNGALTSTDLTLISSGNIQGDGLITATNTVSLTAESDIGLSDQSPIYLNAFSVNATSKTGTVSLATTSGDLNISDISASLVNLNSAANIDLKTTASELVIGNVTAVGTVTLATPSGKISGTNAILSSQLVNLSAGSSIDLYIIGSNALTLGEVSNNGGGIDITNSDGDLLVGTKVTAGGSGDVSLKTVGFGNILLNGTTTATNGTVTMTSAGSISGVGRITANKVDLTAENGMYGSLTDQTLQGVQVSTSNISVTNNIGGKTVVQNNTGDLTIDKISTFQGADVDVGTNGKIYVSSAAVTGKPNLTLGVSGNIIWWGDTVSWNNGYDYYYGYFLSTFLDTNVVSPDTLSGLTLRTVGDIQVFGANEPDLDVGLHASGAVTFEPYIKTNNGNWYGPYFSNTFKSLDVQSDTSISLGIACWWWTCAQISLNTKVGDLSLNSRGALNFTWAALNSAKGLTLSSGAPLVINDNLKLSTEQSTEGNIDLGGLVILSGGPTEAFYSLEILAGSGDITLGTIGIGTAPGVVDPALGLVRAVTTGTVYLDGDIAVKGDGIDVGNSSYVVLKQDVTLTSAKGTVNLGWNADDSTSTPLYSVSRDPVYGTSIGPYTLDVDASNGSVILGPVGQAAPVNVPEAISELWKPLEELVVLSGVAVLNGDIKTNSKLDLGGVNLIELVSNSGSTSIGLSSSDIMLGTVNGPDFGLSVVSNTTTLLGNITTGGNIDLSDATSVILINDVNLKSNNGAVLLSGTITTDADGNDENLIIDAQNGGAQLVDAVKITAGDVSFTKAALTGPGSVDINSSKNVTLYAVGDATNPDINVQSINIVDTNPDGIIELNGSIYSRDAITLQGNVELKSNITFASGDDPVDLSNANINGGYDVVVNAGFGAVTLGNLGQIVSINSLSVSTSGITTFDGDITAVGSAGINMTNAPTIIVGNSTSDSVTLTSGNILLNGGMVDGPGGLDIYTGTGTVALGQIGTTTPLEHLTINGTGLTTFAGNINTGAAGDINLSSATNVNFTGNTVITAATASFAGAVTAAGSVDLTNVDIINVSGGTSFTSAGTIAFLGPMNSAGALAVTSTGGNVLLGDVQAAGANVTITASTGDILNNRGISAPENPLNNITSQSLSLNAGSRIGVSTADPIVVSVPEQITLSFGADMAYIRNMLGSPVYNIGDGVVIDVMRNSLLTAGQSIAMFQNSDDVDITDEDEVEKDEEEEQLTRTVTWLDNTRSPDVPRMIRTPKSWVFTRSNEYVVPASEHVPAKSTVKKAWTKESFKY